MAVSDKAGNAGSVSVTYYVNYSWKGFLQPINLYPDPKSKFKLGSTIPVKFRIADATGKPVTNAQATISSSGCQARAGWRADGGLLLDFCSTSGNLFRYDPTGDLYIYNLGTKVKKGANLRPVSTGVVTFDGVAGVTVDTQSTDFYLE